MKTPKPIRNTVNIIYQPRAGKAKTLRRDIEPDGTVRINDGRHLIGAQAMGNWKGKNPWCRINQDSVQALPWFGEQEPLSPQMFNEAVENHYAKECIQALDAIDKPKEQNTVLFILFGVIILIQIVMGIWSNMGTNGLEDSLRDYIQQQAATHATTTPIDGAITGA